MLHTNSLVLQKCIIRPLEEKVVGGRGLVEEEGGRVGGRNKEAHGLKKRTKTTTSDCIQGLINIFFHQQRMPLVLIQRDTAAGAPQFLF